MTWISWALSSISIAGAILNIFKYKVCFIVWTISNICWISYILISKDEKMIGQIPLWVVFGIINVYGYYKWDKESKE